MFICVLCYFMLIGCCVYEKPRDFSQREQDSDDDDDDHCTDHCRGHRSKDYRHNVQENNEPGSSSGGASNSGDLGQGGPQASN